MRPLALLLALVPAIAAVAAEAAPAAEERHAFENDLAFSGDGDAAPLDSPRPQSAWGAFGALAGYTLVIVLMLCGLLYAVRRLVPGARGWTGSEAIQVLGKRALTPQASIFLVQIGRRVLSVGVSKEGMSSLGEIADPDEIALVRGQCLGKGGEAGFGEALKAQLGEAKAEPAAAPEPAPPADAEVRGELDSIRRVVEGWKKAAAL